MTNSEAKACTTQALIKLGYDKDELEKVIYEMDKEMNLLSVRKTKELQKTTIGRISFKDYCARCYRDFNLFELTNYCPDDNDSFCDDCKRNIHYSSWVNGIYVGETALEAAKNLKQLVHSFNDRLDRLGRTLEFKLSITLVIDEVTFNWTNSKK